MSHKKKYIQPAEVPQPDRNPEIKPDALPEEPSIPADDPDIAPETEPREPSPLEIPHDKN
ncbi:MAG: hypothetical protein JST75_18435 [Bacteroidetes bacterium]|nr:hypothetical protein [Bacteroidota bacterium]